MHARADARDDRVDTAGVHRADLNGLAAELGIVGGHVQLALAPGVEADDRRHQHHHRQDRKEHASIQEARAAPRLADNRRRRFLSGGHARRTSCAINGGVGTHAWTRRARPYLNAHYWTPVVASAVRSCGTTTSPL